MLLSLSVLIHDVAKFRHLPTTWPQMVNHSSLPITREVARAARAAAWDHAAYNKDSTYWRHEGGELAASQWNNAFTVYRAGQHVHTSPKEWKNSCQRRIIDQPIDLLVRKFAGMPLDLMSNVVTGANRT